MRKYLVLFVLLFVGVAFAQTDKTLVKVYGQIGVTACSQDADADANTANVLGPMVAGAQYLVYCHDGAGLGVACECKMGGASVSALTSVNPILFAGEKIILTFRAGSLYISCVPLVNNQYYDVCKMD